MRNFLIGVLLTTLFWLWILSSIEIPEYTIIHKNGCPDFTV